MSNEFGPINNNTENQNEYTRRDFLKIAGVGAVASMGALTGCSKNGGNFLGIGEFASNPSEQYYEVGSGYIDDADYSTSYSLFAKYPTMLDGKPVNIVHADYVDTGLPELPSFEMLIGNMDKDNMFVPGEDRKIDLDSMLQALSADGKIHKENTCEVVVDGKTITGYLIGSANDAYNESSFSDSDMLFSDPDIVWNFATRIVFEGANKKGISVAVFPNTYAEPESNLTMRDYYKDGWGEKLDSIAKLVVSDMRVADDFVLFGESRAETPGVNFD